jgi:hypothetical protein
VVKVVAPGEYLRIRHRSNWYHGTSRIGGIVGIVGGGYRRYESISAGGRCYSGTNAMLYFY